LPMQMLAGEPTRPLRAGRGTAHNGRGERPTQA
jgi:hypothetical protein